MTPTLCLIGGCNGAGKTTLAKELLPRLGLMRFLNADEIARGLSSLCASLCAFKAGRLVIEEVRVMIEAGASFALESTLSGKTYVAMLREARARGFRVVLHYVMIGSAAQAVERVRLGGHHVPSEDVVRRYERSLRHLLDDYLPLADEWECGRIECLLRNRSPRTRTIPSPNCENSLLPLNSWNRSPASQPTPPRSSSKPAASPPRRCSTTTSAWASA